MHTGDSLSLDELNAIAETMTNPVQCGYCGFGPVDHAGCHDLASHHGESTGVGQGRISNSCPRCGRFEMSLSSWPRWNGRFHTPAGRKIFLQRTWCDINIEIR